MKRLTNSLNVLALAEAGIVLSKLSLVDSDGQKGANFYPER